MGKILSQEEIDALLVTARTAGPASAQTREAVPTLDAVLYNFRRPDRVSKDQIRSLHFLHDRFARNVATSLSAFLRAATDVTLVSIEQFTYSEFLMSLPDPTAFYAVGVRPGDGLAALEIGPGVAFAMIDRMLGGTGHGGAATRALTEIEQHVVDAAVKLVLDNLSEAWRSIVDVEFKIHARDTRPQMLQVAAPNEMVVLMVFDMRIGDTRGMLNLCVPAVVIESVGAQFGRGLHRVRREPTEAERQRLARMLSTVSLSVAARLKSRMPAGEMLSLEVGEVLSLGRATRDPVELSVNGLPKFVGHLVQTECGVGLRIEGLHDPRVTSGDNGGEARS